MKVLINISDKNIANTISFVRDLEIDTRQRVCYASANGRDYVRAFDRKSDRDKWVRAGNDRKPEPSQKLPILYREAAKEVLSKMNSEFIRYLELGKKDSVDVNSFIKVYGMIDKAYDFDGEFKKVYAIHKLMSDGFTRESAKKAVAKILKKGE